jgi:KDO2-lipid IV(A) lauroyltransferase
MTAKKTIAGPILKEGLKRGKMGLYLFQALLARGLLFSLGFTPLWFASGFGARMFLFTGPFLKADKVARKNLAVAFPDWDKAQIDRTVREIWENLGRGAGEFSHLHKINPYGPDSPIEVVGGDYLDRYKDKKGILIVSAHMANWEMASLVASGRGMPLNNIYRTAGNPWMDDYIRKMRAGFTSKLIPKMGGLREIMTSMRRGEPLGVLLDQKLNEGVAIPFFGRDAMTPHAPVEMALRLEIPILPVRLERIAPVRFKVTIHPPMEAPNSGDLRADTIQILTRFNTLLEGWIRERPGQWFWVHKRWPNDDPV